MDDSISGPQADPNGNGIPNLLEFAHGDNPRSVEPNHSIDAVFQNQARVISFSRDSLADVTIEILKAEDNLTEFEVIARSSRGAPFAFHTFPAPTIIETPSTADGITNISIIDRESIDRRVFYRLQVAEDPGED